MDFNAVALMVLGTVIASTKDQVNAQIDKAAAAIVAAVKDSETPLDETVVRDLVAPALRRLADQCVAGLV